jgi:hypothetical protein
MDDGTRRKMAVGLKDMEPKPLTDRDVHLARLKELRALRVARETQLLPVAARRRIHQQTKEAADQYLGALPLIKIARCPYDGSLVRKRMDVHGVDGLWWDVGCKDEAPQGDPHVVTYVGAMRDAESLIDKTPSGVKILIGPEIPYVIPRLLEHDGVVCVIAELPIVTRAYIMTYFASPSLAAGESTQPWLRETFYYVDRGTALWNSRSDLMDFDVARWLNRVPPKVYWITPGDVSMTLVSAPPERCPFVNRPGSHSPRVLTQSGISVLPAPTGGSADDVFD